MVSSWEEEEIRQHLNEFYRIVNDQLIKYQHPFSGLFPQRPETSPLNCVAHVRDNVYCATAIWALHRAFQRLGDDSGQSYELRQSAVKCMRAILLGWMRQADRLENFKMTQNLETCLYTRLDYETGTPVDDTGYRHLQMDCVGLYVLQLAQMILSGLQIIHTKVEAAFVQNLIFYIERAYRIPDYGMWERGSKQNRDITELHASSIGMAKAALESMSGFNIFGSEGDHTTVMFADIDAHSRNSSILSTLLPRESASKGTDAALIPTISWPAFAIHTSSIRHATMDRVEILKGNYGYKRFTRDGYATVLESSDFYSQGELGKFRGIENEWPMFFAYQVIAAYFDKEMEKAEQFGENLEQLLVHPVSEKYPWLPKYYFVPEGSLAAEREKPGSQIRRSNFKLRTDPRFLWGQSVYLISQMLLKNVLTIHDLDPLERHCPADTRPMSLLSRYSTITSRPSTMCVQMILLAESTRLQQILATYGIQTQTPVEIEPLKLWPPGTLVKASAFMGFNRRLGLKGRPPRPLGCLGASKYYRVSGSTVLVFPHLFEDQSFYFSYDIKALIEEVKNDLIFLSKWWRMKGRPNYCFLVKEDMIIGHGREQLIRFLVSLQSNYVDGVRIVLGRAQNFVATGCIDHLDFFPDWAANSEEFEGLKQLYGGRSFRSLTDLPRVLDDEDLDALLPAPLVIAIADATNRRHFKKMSDSDIVNFVLHDGNRQELWPYKPPDPPKGKENVFTTPIALRAIDYAQEAAALHELMHRHGLDYALQPNGDPCNVRDFFSSLSRRAGINQIWTVVRLTSALLSNYVHSLAPSTSAILVCGKQLTIGTIQGPEIAVNKPTNPRELCDLLRDTVYHVDPLQMSLQQELILYVAALLNKDKSLFENIAIIRLGSINARELPRWFLEAMKLHLEAEESRASGERVDVRKIETQASNEAYVAEARSLGACRLQSLSPSSLKSLLHRTLCSENLEHTPPHGRQKRFNTPHSREQSPALNEGNKPSVDMLYQRQLDGCLGRVPKTFYESVYHILERSPCGVLIMNNLLPQVRNLVTLLNTEIRARNDEKCK
ncbi:unnamed protein product [Hymenolepis diminuta]|uniref:Phosphorylase b kinase regulatory subunit n=1 Tax=Hymenolepis diminuta TaxID=6216 RepID=A0A158QBJ8_HYMDI|nr:unnamed protein product [Hymenolepis diminuta]